MNYKKNFFPNILHKNIKNYRNLNRGNLNNCNYLNNCSKKCPTKINKNTLNYYEKIYGGLDFRKEKYKILECYKNPKFKNRTTMGMQIPNKSINKCENNTNFDIQCINNKREKQVNMKINPYIPKSYENIDIDKINNIKNELNNKNNYKYSNYSNYLKKKKFIRYRNNNC